MKMLTMNAYREIIVGSTNQTFFVSKKIHISLLALLTLISVLLVSQEFYNLTKTYFYLDLFMLKHAGVFLVAMTVSSPLGYFLSVRVNLLIAAVALIVTLVTGYWFLFLGILFGFSFRIFDESTKEEK